MRDATPRTPSRYSVACGFLKGALAFSGESEEEEDGGGARFRRKLGLMKARPCQKTARNESECRLFFHCEDHSVVRTDVPPGGSC